MELPEEALRKGRITIYNDTPREIVLAAEEYREHVDKCRKRSAFVEEIEFGYLVMNILLGLVLTALCAERAAEMLYASLPIMLLNIFAYIFFGVIKRNLLFCTLCMALFITLSPLFIIVVIADFVLFFMHKHITDWLKTEPGYPAFAHFQVHYVRGNKPDDDEEEKEDDNSVFEWGYDEEADEDKDAI